MEQYRKTLLINVNECKSMSLISVNVDDSYVSTAIVNAQEIYLPTLIGTALYHRIQELVYNEINHKSPRIYDSQYSVYNECLQEYIKPLLKYRTAIDLMYNISFKIRNIGTVKNSDTNVNYPDMTEIKYLEKQYSTYYNTYCERLSKFLKSNIDSIPELKSDVPIYFDKASIDKKYANDGGLWLGSDDKNNCECI